MTPGPADTTSQNPITIRTFISESEAEIAKGALTAFGIESLLSHDDCGGQRPHLTLTGGIRLLVRPEDAERAEEALTADAEAE
jgi:hypothetical protein